MNLLCVGTFFLSLFVFFLKMFYSFNANSPLKVNDPKMRCLKLQQQQQQDQQYEFLTAWRLGLAFVDSERDCGKQ